MECAVHKLQNQLAIITAILFFQTLQLCALDAKGQLLDPPQSWHPDPCAVDFSSDGLVGGSDFAYIRRDVAFATYRQIVAEYTKALGQRCGRNEITEILCPELRLPPHCVELRLYRDGGFAMGASELPGCGEATR